jgi:hypothetical protein
MQMKQFTKICEALRANDPTLTRIDANEYPDGYGQELGRALVDNTVVSELILNVSHAAQSEDVFEDESSGLYSLFEFIMSSSSLRTVSLFNFDGDDRDFVLTMGALVMKAIAIGTDFEVVNCFVSVPASDFAWFLNTTRTVTILDMFLDDIVEDDDDDDDDDDENDVFQVLANAFHDNRTLQSFSFYSTFQTNLPRMVLQSLLTHATLQKLVITNQAATQHLAQVTVIADFVRALSSATTANSSSVLQHLSLNSFQWDATRLEHLISALQQHHVNVNTNTFLTILAFSDGSFDAEAADALIALARNITSTSIRELQLHRCDNEDDNDMFDDYYTMGSMAAELLIASPLQSFKLGGASVLDLRALCDAMGSLVPNQITLPRLHLESLGMGQVCVLADALERFPHLRELTVTVSNDVSSSTVTDDATAIDDDDDDDDAFTAIVQRMARSIRSNGSLFQVSIVFEDGRPFFTEQNNCLIRAYCQRNQDTLALLTAKSRSDNDSETEVETVLDAAMVEDNDEMMADQDLVVSLFPALFCSTRPARHTLTVRTALSGLLGTCTTTSDETVQGRPDQHREN